jgi:hypothetical protein
MVDMAGGRRRSGRSKRPRQRRIPTLRVALGPEVGPGVVTASLEDFERAIRAQAVDLDWDAVAENVIPVMPRVRPYPAGFPSPMQVIVDPGVAVGYAIDIGPGFMSVGPDLIRSWGISLADVQARSLANTIERAGAIDAAAVVEGPLDGTATRWLQTGQSIGSVLILVPDALTRIFGPEPAFFITPMRDLIIGFPATVERDLALWLWAEIAANDPNCLGPIGYRFEAGRVTPEPLNVESLGLGQGGNVAAAYLA